MKSRQASSSNAHSLGAPDIFSFFQEAAKMGWIFEGLELHDVHEEYHVLCAYEIWIAK